MYKEGYNNICHAMLNYNIRMMSSLFVFLANERKSANLCCGKTIFVIRLPFTFVISKQRTFRFIDILLLLR